MAVVADIVVVEVAVEVEVIVVTKTRNKYRYNIKKDIKKTGELTVNGCYCGCCV